MVVIYQYEKFSINPTLPITPLFNNEIFREKRSSFPNIKRNLFLSQKITPGLCDTPGVAF